MDDKHVVSTDFLQLKFHEKCQTCSTLIWAEIFLQFVQVVLKFSTIKSE